MIRETMDLCGSHLCGWVILPSSTRRAGRGYKNEWTDPMLKVCRTRKGKDWGQKEDFSNKLMFYGVRVNYVLLQQICDIPNTR